MCGRYTLTAPGEVLGEIFETEESVDWAPRYNLAPTQEVAVLGLDPQGSRSILKMRWGLIPSWAKDPAIGNRLINARAETVAEKPSYRSSFKKRRCLLLADGFYEWKKVDGIKQPYYFRLEGHRPFAVAGLWSRWRRDGDEGILSCSLITTEANPATREVHDRMPVILRPQDYDSWLNPVGDDAEAHLDLLRPYPGDDLEAFAVSTRVNNPRNDAADLIEPL